VIALRHGSRDTADAELLPPYLIFDFIFLSPLGREVLAA
jgi:hypothetical protein